mmetsp:Transcript_41397/g.108827  ORF Transcript_41397/g.108827 Transcript_41397/m.108827 type:complete len:211 (+) Transcript_41397:3350-3982(+)
MCQRTSDSLTAARPSAVAGSFAISISAISPAIVGLARAKHPTRPQTALVASGTRVVESHCFRASTSSRTVDWSACRKIRNIDPPSTRGVTTSKIAITFSTLEGLACMPVNARTRSSSIQHKLGILVVHICRSPTLARGTMFGASGWIGNTSLISIAGGSSGQSCKDRSKAGTCENIFAKSTAVVTAFSRSVDSMPSKANNAPSITRFGAA